MIEQNFIAIDLELNQPSNKIIQVGVAIGNSKQNPKDYTVEKWYVDPEEPIDGFIIDLTGITNSDIRTNCVRHKTIAHELGEIIKQHDPWLQAVVWGFNDVGVLRKEFEERSVEFNYLGGRWIDLKTVYNFLQFSKGQDPRGGLQKVMHQNNCWFEGSQHRADIDAQNTLKFWFELMRRQKNMFDLLDDSMYNDNMFKETANSHPNDKQFNQEKK